LSQDISRDDPKGVPESSSDTGKEQQQDPKSSSSALSETNEVDEDKVDAKPAAHPEAAHWSLQADRMAITMPLVDALRLMAGFYGRRTSNSGLTAGLPIPKEGITPELFVRAAMRANMSAQLIERSLESLVIAPNLPCILSLADNQACILWEIQHNDESGKVLDKPSFVVQFPETPDEKQVLTFDVLDKLYVGYSFFVRPIARVDDRAGPAEIDTGRNWFWATFWENRTIYGEVGLAAIMINLFGIASSLFVMNVYDRVVPNGEAAMHTLWAMGVGILIVYFSDFLLRNLRARFLDFAGRKADVIISAQLFEQILGMTMTARPQSAGVLAANMKEFETLRDFFTSATLVALIDLPFVFLFIFIIWVIGGPVAVVPLAAVPLVVGMGLFLQKPLEKVIKESLHESALKNAHLFETIVGLETIKVQAAEGHSQRAWEELSEKSSRTTVKSKQIASFAQNWAVFIQQIVSAVIVIVGVFLINDGALSMGGLIACVILSGRAMAPLAQVSGLLTKMNQSRQGLDQLDDLMKKPVERPAGKHFITMPEIKGLVEFRDVVFSYPGQAVPALNAMSFTIQPGEKVGIIGAVGSGKTTLERLLINLYEPTSGSVQIDGTDVRQIDPGDLRRNVGAVQQSPQLFFGSVRDNITMGHETAPDSAVLRAAEMSGVMEFLKDSQAGLDTQVGERGEALSGGQRQAVAIARALLYDPKILILDEPTASMDPASENRLRSRLNALCVDKTTILITHKGAMLNIVDKLILMDRGKLVAFGPKDDVIRKLQARQYGTAAESTEV